MHKTLISMPVGMRPDVSELAVRAMTLQYPHAEIHAIDWKGDTGNRLLDLVSVLELSGGTKAECLNLSLTLYQTRYGISPDIWMCADDDAVLEIETDLAALEVFEHPIGRNCWMLGVRNTVSETRPNQQMGFGGQLVQIGENFCTGGGCAIHPKVAIEELGGYPTSKRRRQDDHLRSTQVRNSGHHAWTLESRHVAILRDEDRYPSYRLHVFRIEKQDRLENGLPELPWMEEEIVRLEKMGY